MASATPRLPEEDSISTESGVSTPSRSAASTISLAALSLIEPAKLKPSHLRYSGTPATGRRSTWRSAEEDRSGAVRGRRVRGGEDVIVYPEAGDWALAVCRRRIRAREDRPAG